MKRRGKAATAGGSLRRRQVVHKGAALPLPGASLRALVNNIGDGIRRARFFHTFWRDTGSGNRNLIRRIAALVEKLFQSDAVNTSYCAVEEQQISSLTVQANGRIPSSFARFAGE